MAIGTNLKYGNAEKIWPLIFSAFRFRRHHKMVGSRDTDATSTTRIGKVCTKAGAPADNTAADAPSGINDLCYDSTNKDVYRCSAFTDSSTFTWTKIDL